MLLAVNRKESSPWLSFILIGIPLLITLVLFYIDEGYYDFRWMKQPGNWVPFFLYWGAMIFGEFLMHYMLPKNMSGTQRITLILLIGMPLGVLLLFLIVFGGIKLWSVF